MTIQEKAIARIKEHMLIHKMNEPRAIHISEALVMAIKALEQQPCEDTISRQAAIDVLEERLQASGYSNVALVSELNRSIGYLMRLPSAQPEQRWIPCSEQLPPEENKTYWVCTDNGHQHECRWTNANPIWTHLTTDWHWNIFDIPQYTKVVAWMELPKPYDGGEQDG